MRFVWDEKKNLVNIKKHGFGFAQVLPAFSDPMRKEYYDEKHSGLEEDRYFLVGFAQVGIILASFTEPEPETVRLISPRMAEKYKVEVYYNRNG